VSQGVGAVLREDIRWDYCHIKAVALLPNVMLKQYARDKDGSIEAILYRDGYITEGAASNVFIVAGDVISTPPKSNRLLPGITRDLVVELIGTSTYQCREVPVSKTELMQADEIWITSSSLGIAPVVRLDGRPVRDGKPGPVWRDVDAIYQAFKRGE
jgi:D-alanine transaminase